MKSFRLWIFTCFLTISILSGGVVSAIALDATEKTEVVVQKSDSTKVKTDEIVTEKKAAVTEEKMERSSSGNSSYNFIFYLVTIIMKALSYYPQR